MGQLTNVYSTKATSSISIKPEAANDSNNPIDVLDLIRDKIGISINPNDIVKYKFNFATEAGGSVRKILADDPNNSVTEKYPQYIEIPDEVITHMIYVDATLSTARVYFNARGQ